MTQCKHGVPFVGGQNLCTMLGCNPLPKPMKPAKYNGVTLTELDAQVLDIITLNPGAYTCKTIAEKLDIQDETYGPYQAVSRSIVRLRKAKLVQDVSERCPHCNSALSRGNKDVPLYPAVKVADTAA